MTFKLRKHSLLAKRILLIITLRNKLVEDGLNAGNQEENSTDSEPKVRI